MSIRQAVTPFVIQCGASIHIMHSSKGEINLITKEREKSLPLFIIPFALMTALSMATPSLIALTAQFAWCP